MKGATDEHTASYQVRTLGLGRRANPRDGMGSYAGYPAGTLHLINSTVAGNTTANQGGGINLWLAWGYVAFRIVHSIIQATVNIVAIRFPLFALASLCLLGLTVHAGARILHDCGILAF